MSLKKIKFRNPAGRYALIAVAVAAALGGLYLARADVAASAAYQGLDRRLPESRLLADWMIDAAPSDPYVRLAAAHYFERTFEANDIDRGIAEYEQAAALSPEHYGIWLQLGAARDRNGDSAGAEKAYARALELAPAYASVHWGYGNSLLRHGDVEKGFESIARAAASDPGFTEPAVLTGLRFFDGDPNGVRTVLGSTGPTNAALTNVLASQGKWDLAYDAWSRIPESDKAMYIEMGTRVMNWATDAHQMRIAASIYADLLTDLPPPSVGAVANGGFEAGLKLRNAGIFEWQIAEGSEPQIGLSESVKKSGRYSMSIVFNSFEASEFRTVWQRLPVEPGANYEFQAFYRADIKSKAGFKWEIIDLKQNVLASTESLALNGDWATLQARFTVPASLDGVIIRFVRTGCGATGACPVSGKVFFDDLSLQRI